MKSKNNKTKLIALMLLLCAVTLMFSSCFWIGGKAQRVGFYYSHDEFVEFIKKYNSKNDGFVSTFISFDFDEADDVGFKRYEWGMIVRYSRLIGDPVYDKYHKYQDNLGINMIFYVNDTDCSDAVTENAYQILCTYDPHSVSYNYSQSELSMEIYNDTLEKPHYFNYHKSDSLFTPDGLEYHYIETYVMKVKGNEIMQISIASLKEDLSQEQLDEICQLLLDNIVIINTEG